MDVRVAEIAAVVLVPRAAEVVEEHAAAVSGHEEEDLASASRTAGVRDRDVLGEGRKIVRLIGS